MRTLGRPHAERADRRAFLRTASALGAAALGLPRRASAEPPPETRRIRLLHAPVLCLAPQFLAEELLRLEGFSEVEYVKWSTGSGASAVAAGRADLSMWETPGALPLLDAGRLVVLAGIHSGCIEIFGGRGVRTLRDLKGKTIAISEHGGSEHIFLSSTLAYVGIDPRRGVKWVTTGAVDATMRMFVDGKSDAFFAFPPQPQELRARNIGRVIVDTLRDRPWSQYFCCSIFANRDFVAAHPVATKRAMRAILKAADMCAREPDQAARYMVAKGYERRLEVALEVLRGLPYRKWRDDNPEDTIRFYGLRLHEVGMIKTTPNRLIAQATDWRFLNELKRELKA